MIACISVPYFAAAVERRAAADLAALPLAIGGRPWEARPIFAFSHEVARLGVRPGMTLRLAHALSPEARFLPAAQPRYRHASGEIVDMLLDHSPTVEPHELWHPFADRSLQFTADGRTLPARYLLDLDGLPAPDSLELARALGRLLRHETRLAPAIGLATGRFAAQVAATLTRPNHARLIEPGRDATFLAPQPVNFLPLEAETLRRLRLLGIHTLGGLARLSRSAAVAQFGPTIEPFHRLARGRPPQQPAARPHTAPQHEFASNAFEPPVADTQVLAAVVRQLAAQLAARLAAATVAARAVYLAWDMDDGRRDQRVITLRRPSADAQHLTAVWLDLLDAAVAGLRAAATDDTPAGLARLTLGSRDLTAPPARQPSLFHNDAPDTAAGWANLRPLLERHGPELFLRPAPAETDHPLPERRFRWLPATETAHDPALA